MYAGQNLSDVFQAMHVMPDFDAAGDEHLFFVHRRLNNGGVYFIDNRSEKSIYVDAVFRLTGKAPELWHAETGKSEPASYQMSDGRTTVPLHLEPWGTVFVVFRHATTQQTRTLPKETEKQLATLDGPWTVRFEPGRGAPASATFDKLISWPDSSDEGVKYFSGAGTYSKTLEVPTDWTKGGKLWLDLGDVKNLAQVTVNSKDLGVVWHAPYRVDVSGALKPGSNEIQIKVINAWVNRLIGDQQPEAKEKYTFADVKPYRANSPLLQSGLIGPVVLYSDSSR